VYQYLSGDVAAMTATRLNGQQTGISKPVIEAMRVAGLSHLLSTSGFHVTVMALLVYFPLRALLALIPWLVVRVPIKKWAAFGAVASALGYTFLVGSGAATLRSMAMTGVAMLAIVVDRRAAAMRLVMLSAALAMLIAPDAAMGPSFQMSFAAVFCLIAANEKAWRWTVGQFETLGPEWLRSAGAHLWGIVRTSLIATAATTPFALYHFQSFSFYGFAANMLAIPMTSFWVMPSILMAYVTAPLGWDELFIRAAGWGIGITIKIALLVASWPYSIIDWPAMPGAALAAIVLGGLWLCLWQTRWRYFGLVPIVIGMMYPLYIKQPDLFVSPDGKEWAARLADGRLAVSDLTHENFAVTQWQQRLGNPPLVDVSELPVDDARIRCDTVGCVARYGKIQIALPILPAAALEDCTRADAVIAPVPIRDCAAPVVVDDTVLWRHGAAALFIDDDHVRVETIHARRGARPWSAGYRAPKYEADEE
jgi:competence protein ComEC